MNNTPFRELSTLSFAFRVASNNVLEDNVFQEFKFVIAAQIYYYNYPRAG